MKTSTYPAIILAGGLGTRLRTVINDLSKPMAPVNGKPFLHYIFQYLVKQNISAVVLSVGYKHEVIREYFSDEYLGIEIRYSVEQEPLGTGGGIKQAFQLAGDFAFVLNGDTFFDVQLEELKKFYFNTQSDVVLSLKRLSDFDRYGTVVLDKENRIASFVEKQFLMEGLINGGVYFFNKNLFNKVETGEKFSLEKDVLEKYAKNLKFSGKTFEGYFIDIGIPEDYQKAQNDLV